MIELESMKYLQWGSRSWCYGLEFALRASAVALAASLSLSPTSATAQEKDQEPRLPQVLQAPLPPDTVLPKINVAIQGVTTSHLAALADALHIGGEIGGKLQDEPPGAPRNSLQAIGDIDGDGIPEVLLKWSVPDEFPGADIAPDPNSRPLWSLYLISWDGVHWKASRLEPAIEHFTQALIELGPPVGRALALVIPDEGQQTSYPAVFQMKEHAASLLWDSQADDSRYQPLIGARIEFQDRSGTSSEMTVTGRADPGLLRVARDGKRGFEARTVYHWEGKEFVPAKTEYTADQDYTLYRFISALHLHDYGAAYALVVPARFLNSDSPSLDLFRKFVGENWPELLQDNVFQAPDLPAGSPDPYLFVLPKPDQRFVYHPDFSKDGKFLLTGLTRTREVLAADTQ
jgi:hypothetical protein